ncbi:unnamed protein product [Macrosiphum euphorbiae]|uniref:Uncharacterized protein n=1 Tax=Macrosiphum euphorbiae TaxID=13131 RepID=A0AAV0Y622_9HEMI|nr:unnamed protein product [Macrosiphum euphorbiae]
MILNKKTLLKSNPKNSVNQCVHLKWHFMQFFWNDILERFDLTSHLLLDPKIVLQTAVNALNSLLSFVQEIRNKYEEYEEKAKQMSGLKDYAPIRYRKKKWVTG